ncbi:hypothetical protein TSUD_95820 [Trifolium subterraneum]|uniref:Uncharacterized protein n=1 Tax=Trifolium subterraneum TaxID=3900 RepID=A0A2Z6P9B6_TRISU|nr:hypothetical protein TSUD_95820 [Trifolium subterraneum]
MFGESIGEDLDCRSQSRIKGETNGGVDLVLNQGVIKFLLRNSQRTIEDLGRWIKLQLQVLKSKTRSRTRVQVKIGDRLEVKIVAATENNDERVETVGEMLNCQAERLKIPFELCCIYFSKTG